MTDRIAPQKTQLRIKAYSYEEILQEKGYFVYTLVGHSMMPLLRQRRDIIEIRKKGTERCKKFDVVLYKYGERYILHRILKVREKDYVICGDHNIYCEYGITDEMILGVMTRIIRNGKSIYPADWEYRLYVHLWCDFFPVRVGIMRIKMMAGATLRRIKRLLIPVEEKNGKADG